MTDFKYVYLPLAYMTWDFEEMGMCQPAASWAKKTSTALPIKLNATSRVGVNKISDILLIYSIMTNVLNSSLYIYLYVFIGILRILIFAKCIASNTYFYVSGILFTRLTVISIWFFIYKHIIKGLKSN